MRLIIRWYRMWRFKGDKARALRFMRGYNQAMINLGIERHERKRALRELLDAARSVQQ